MTLNPRQIRLLNRGLAATQWALVLGIMGLAVHYLSASPDLKTSVAPIEESVHASHQTHTVRPLSWYESIWTRDLRQPPFEPKVEPPPLPPKPPPPPPPPPPPAMRLLGTAVEEDDQFGMFIDSKGKLVIRRINQTIDGFTISVIERGRVQVKNEVQSVWLTMPDYENKFGAQSSHGQ